MSQFIVPPSRKIIRSLPTLIQLLKISGDANLNLGRFEFIGTLHLGRNTCKLFPRMCDSIHAQKLKDLSKVPSRTKKLVIDYLENCEQYTVPDSLASQEWW